MEGRDFSELLIGALAETMAYEKGMLNRVRTDRVEISARKAAVRPPTHYSASNFRSVRERSRCPIRDVPALRFELNHVVNA
jgi:hypothetical protein